MSILSMWRKLMTRKPARKPVRRTLAVEQLEDRSVPASLATFGVDNLLDSGVGSFRQAILDANAHPGDDVIQFNVAGMIRLTSGALPTIVDTVDIDGTSTPGYAGTPLVEIDFDGFGGLRFDAGSDSSGLRALSLVNASGAGVSLNGTGEMLIVGNYIGLELNGTTVAGNSGNGLELIASSGNTIGGAGAGQFNVISGNQGNGIALYESSNNWVLANYIGTDATGAFDRGNAGNGILLSSGSDCNLIGGSETGGNDPTNHVFARPPQGNLISANDANGVLITGGSSDNTLSGNFIGTTAAGSDPLGNTLDGVAIVCADGNSLIGCTITDDPFVYYNVISGNGGNGLRVSDADYTTIQANFFGVGADNNTAVGNGRNGVLVEGTSAYTVLGGPIPLGNVIAANVQNGIVVRNSASDFTSYNSFCGLAAFSDNPNLGNGLDGMLITSSGANILIRTNVIARNGDDGIEISGAANGVRVTGNIIGLNTSGALAMGNLSNGIEVAGNAACTIIGGPQPTFNIIPYNIISANGGSGIAVVDAAHHTQISASYIGTEFFGTTALGNAHAGISLDAGSSFTTIGSADPSLLTLISGNLGDGVDMVGTNNNTVVGALIGTDFTGVLPLGNAGNGVSIFNGFNNIIGRNFGGMFGAGSPANAIAFNGANGVLISGGGQNGAFANSIHDNGLLGIDLQLGANANQSAPVLTSVKLHPLGVRIAGIVPALPPMVPARVEFFASDTNAASGRVFLGTQMVLPDIMGLASFDFVGPTPPTGANFFTATASSVGNNTSEFSTAATAYTPVGPIAASHGYDMPLFSWNPTTNADHYGLVVVDNTVGATVINLQDLPMPSHATTRAEALTPGHSFTWYGIAYGADGQAYYESAGRTFSLEKLAAPTLTGPTGTLAATAGYDRPTFTWTAVAGADHYYLYVVDNTTGQAVIDSPNVSCTSFTPSNALTPGHSFTWYVGAESTNNVINSYNPAGRTFTLAALAAPTLLGPAADVTIPVSEGFETPTFTWTAVAGASHYYLYVVDNVTSQVVIDNRNVEGTSFTASSALTPGHSFTWYVGAESTNNVINSYNPAGRTFSVAGLAAPTLLGPAAGASIAASAGFDMPTFTWTASCGADHYYLYVVDSTTNQVVIDNPNVYATSFTPSRAQALTPGHTFTWYVGAENSNNTTNSYDPTGQTFSLAALAAPTRISPAADASIPASPGYDMPTFTWTAVAGADHYYLYVVDNTTGQAVINNPNVNGTTFTPSNALTPGRSYTWYVGAESTNNVINSYDLAGQMFTLEAQLGPD